MTKVSFCGIGLSYRRGLCSLFVQLYRAMREPLDDERQREVHAFFCVDMQKNDMIGLLLAISLPKRLKRRIHNKQETTKKLRRNDKSR